MSDARSFSGKSAQFRLLVNHSSDDAGSRANSTGGERDYGKRRRHDDARSCGVGPAHLGCPNLCSTCRFVPCGGSRVLTRLESVQEGAIRETPVPFVRTSRTTASGVNMPLPTNREKKWHSKRTPNR